MRLMHGNCYRSKMMRRVWAIVRSFSPLKLDNSKCWHSFPQPDRDRVSVAASRLYQHQTHRTSLMSSTVGICVRGLRQTHTSTGPDRPAPRTTACAFRFAGSGGSEGSGTPTTARIHSSNTQEIPRTVQEARSLSTLNPMPRTPPAASPTPDALSR